MYPTLLGLIFASRAAHPVSLMPFADKAWRSYAAWEIEPRCCVQAVAS